MKSIALNKFEALPNHLKNEVNNFIEFLLDKEKRKKKDKKNIKDFSGILTEKEAVEFEKSILECRKIDLNEW